MEISDRLKFQIQISGHTYPVQTIPGLQACICMNVKQHLPSCMIYLPDLGNQIHDNLPINDGTKIAIKMSDTRGKDFFSFFRSFGTPKRSPMQESGNVNTYIISGLLDAVPFVNSRPNTAIKGSSQQVFSQIAQNNQLNLKSNAQTNDEMYWLPGRKSWAQFADYVCHHAYVDANSMLSWGVDELKNLHFVNIPHKFNSQDNLDGYIYYGAPDANTQSDPSITQDNTFLAFTYTANNSSGIYNTLGAYGTRTSQVQLNGNPTKHLDVNATTYNNKLDINSDISGQVKPVSNMRLPPMDTGNAHANYITALHQNHRLTCTYVQNIYVLLNSQSNLKLYDKIKFTSSASDSPNDMVNGVYLITAISRCVFSGFYYEKLELTNNGPLVKNPELLS